MKVQLSGFRKQKILIKQPVSPQEDNQMAEKLDQSELGKFKELLISIEELLISHSIQIDAVTQILVEKGITTNEELAAKLKKVQMDYQKKSHG